VGLQNVTEKAFKCWTLQGAVLAHSTPLKCKLLKAGLHHGGQIFRNIMNVILCKQEDFKGLRFVILFADLIPTIFDINKIKQYYVAGLPLIEFSFTLTFLCFSYQS